MGDAIRVSGPINADGLELTIETGKLANLADGAVVLTVGDTVVLSTVATSSSAIRFVAPMTLLGSTALSVEIRTKR